MAPQAMVTNSAGKRKPPCAALFTTATPSFMIACPVVGSTAAVEAKKPVNAGICKSEAAPAMPAPMMPTTARMIMPYSR